MPAPTSASSIDLFSDDVLRDPYPSYAELRKLGSCVWMEKGGYYAIPTFDAARRVLGDHRTFISGEGVGLNQLGNQSQRGTIIASDGEYHARLRAVVAEQVSPRGLRSMTEEIQAKADGLVASLAGRRFDAVPEFSRRFPAMIVLNLIGLAEDDAPAVLELANDSFNRFGPETSPRTFGSLGDPRAVFKWAGELIASGRLRPGSLGDAVIQAHRDGRIPAEGACALIVAYLVGGLDTTITALQQTARLFAEHPGEFEKLRQTPALAPSAFVEILRYAAPLHCFSRLAAQDAEVDGVKIARGARVLVLFASANRDASKYPDADRFDIARNPIDQLAFGYGVHGCPGQGLARMEVLAILTAMARHVKRVELHAARRWLNNLIHGYETMDVTFN